MVTSNRCLNVTLLSSTTFVDGTKILLKKLHEWGCVNVIFAWEGGRSDEEMFKSSNARGLHKASILGGCTRANADFEIK